MKKKTFPPGESPEELKDLLEEAHQEIKVLQAQFRAYGGMVECGGPCVPGRVKLGCSVHGKQQPIFNINSPEAVEFVQEEPAKKPVKVSSKRKRAATNKRCAGCGTPIHMIGQTKCYECLYPNGL